MALLLLYIAVLFHNCVSDSYVISDGQLRIISSSDTCNIGLIEINDEQNGWIPLTSTSHCDLSSIYHSFDSNIGDIVCKQLGFNKLNSYQGKSISLFGYGYNTIHCDQDATNICQQCKFDNQNSIMMDTCDSKPIEIECDQPGTDLKCIPIDQFVEDDNMENKCNKDDSIDNKNGENIISYNLASKPFYEDDTFILVVVIIGLVLGACITICIVNYVQSEYGSCMQCRKCIICITCRCFGYEGDEPEPVPFDVSPQKKARLKAAQKGFDEQTSYW